MFMSSPLAARSFLSKHGFENSRVLADVPRNDEFNWACEKCGRKDRFMRRLRCECGQFAPMRSLRRAVQAKHDLGKKVVQPPWQKGAGSFSEIARQKAPRRKGPKQTQQSPDTEPLAESDVPSLTGAPSADWIAKFCPQDLQEQLKTLASEEAAQKQVPQAKQKKLPANQVEAERSLTKAQKQFAAAEKRCEECKEQVRKNQ